MKTYPFLRLIIRLYWLALIILIGLLVSPVTPILWPDERSTIAEIANLPANEMASIAPELATEIKLGKTLFKGNCGTCHNRNMKSNMTGPALRGVRERWSDYPITDLYSWIRNSAGLIEKGHPKAIEVFNEYKKVPMTSFNALSDEDAAAILTYVESVK